MPTLGALMAHPRRSGGAAQTVGDSLADPGLVGGQCGDDRRDPAAVEVAQRAVEGPGGGRRVVGQRVGTAPAGRRGGGQDRGRGQDADRAGGGGDLDGRGQLTGRDRDHPGPRRVVRRQGAGRRSGGVAGLGQRRAEDPLELGPADARRGGAAPALRPTGRRLSTRRRRRTARRRAGSRRRRRGRRRRGRRWSATPGRSGSRSARRPAPRTAASSAWASGWAGTRRPTVGAPPVTASAMRGPRRRISRSAAPARTPPPAAARRRGRRPPSRPAPPRRARCDDQRVRARPALDREDPRDRFGRVASAPSP